MTSRFVLFAALLLLLVFGTGPAWAAEIIGLDAQSLDIEAHQGRLIRLPAHADHVFVADPAIADVQVKTPTLIYIYGKKAGETALYALDHGERVLLNKRVVVKYNLERLRDQIRTTMPDSNIDVDTMNGGLMIGGEVLTARQAEDIRLLAVYAAGDEKNVINRLTVNAPNQVNLRVRVAEMSRDVIKDLGFNWDVFRSVRDGQFQLGVATGRAPRATSASSVTSTATSTTTTTAAITPTFNSHTNIALGNATIMPNNLMLHAKGFLDLTLMLDILDKEGLVSMLAEPNLTAMSGETANFLAGGEFPIIIPQGNGTYTIEFKKFGVSLAFTPTVLGEGRINVHVRPEVSQLASEGSVTLNNFVIPGLTVRRAETTVELGSGQSFAIAGLLKNNVDHDISQLPGLGDIPVLGPLFRSEAFRRSETELVVIVTPYLVRPVSTRLAAPTDGFDPPHDLWRILFGANYRQRKPGESSDGAKAPETKVNGPVGFILE